ncbi:hypothetical protein BJ912DRAFT_924282 [Pholiota molesta]|nr:hypothetical protein BJ912DRAFT_924282 [Pholiota molesta]
MASQPLRVILDDNAGNVTYSGGQWTVSQLVQWYQGTSNFPAFVQPATGIFGTLSLAFQGTSVAFIGNTPTSGLSQSATIAIDGGTPYNITYGAANPPAYIQWYQSPSLTDGHHTITASNLAGTALDMAIITVGPNTPLAGTKIFVDNNDPSLQYSGSWAESQDGFDAGTLPDGLPVGNTTQRTTSIGDTMTFRFSGTSISIYGIFSWTNIGSISATYTIDGVPSSLSYPVTSSSPEHVSADKEASNFVFFDQEGLSAGPHMLVLNVTDIRNQIFILDYIVYTPSFSSQATMPDLTATSTTTGSTTPTNLSTNSNSATQTAIGANQGNAQSKSTPIGAIVGGVLGGLAVLVLAVILFLYLRRQRSKGAQSPAVEQKLVANTDNVLPAAQPSFGNSASATNAAPFPMTTTTTGFASISDLKRDRHEQEQPRRAASPYSSDARSHTTSLDISQRNTSHAAGSSTGPVMEVDSEYVPSESVPPAYDTVPTRPGGPLSPVRR